MESLRTATTWWMARDCVRNSYFSTLHAEFLLQLRTTRPKTISRMAQLSSKSTGQLMDSSMNVPGCREWSIWKPTPPLPMLTVRPIPDSTMVWSSSSLYRSSRFIWKRAFARRSISVYSWRSMRQFLRRSTAESALREPKAASNRISQIADTLPGWCQLDGHQLHASCVNCIDTPTGNNVDGAILDWASRHGSSKCPTLSV